MWPFDIFKKKREAKEKREHEVRIVVNQSPSAQFRANSLYSRPPSKPALRTGEPTHARASSGGDDISHPLHPLNPLGMTNPLSPISMFHSSPSHSSSCDSDSSSRSHDSGGSYSSSSDSYSSSSSDSGSSSSSCD